MNLELIFGGALLLSERFLPIASVSHEVNIGD